VQRPVEQGRQDKVGWLSHLSSRLTHQATISSWPTYSKSVSSGRLFVRHSYATAGRDAKIDWRALSQRIGHADVAFTMRQYVQSDLEADRQVATTLAELIIGGVLASVPLEAEEGHDDAA
jgi:site-specific recombinase XerC